MTTVAKHIIFRGTVQGVGFRFTVFGVASRLQLGGFVRNLHDGTVEMVVQGPQGEVKNCIEDINGSFRCDIETEIKDIDYNPIYNDFKITF
ncbi:MAG: acylphosphatase [Planctomycetes bacterium]|nr:acylphosphatase [Planctomycetota bacterium]